MIQSYLSGISPPWLWALLAVAFLLWLLIVLALVRLLRRPPPGKDDLRKDREARREEPEAQGRKSEANDEERPG